ncbi:response regulator [Caenimonas sedimenti]|uniref:histidine kinase n=1 Tax=Caenimonas sedimenti TaxID=2596921 RepID=A0A562ZWX6_9BURK|nr:response regulator [Caenimonas sedimenti]TWO73109.1 response regulator [Caenimonas sedimenti]
MTEMRVLIHAPRGRDGAVVEGVLTQQGIACKVCESHDDLIDCLLQGAACVILTEEALPELQSDQRLLGWLEAQPSWSDFPFVVLATKREGRRADKDFRSLHSLGNLVLLERPLNAETLASAAESAVRARRRQYAARTHLEELSNTRSELERLNGELEDRILRRTKELASANDRLMKEINERERAQAALTQVQKMEAIGRLTGGIAHDFNNLLHVVNMNLELVSIYAKEEKVKPVVERAKSAARRGSRLTNQLLSFARSQSLLPKLTQVNQLLMGMKDLIEISVGSAVEVEFDLCEEPAPVVVDPSQFEMAILNLAVNSRDAMPEGGKMKVSTRTATLEAGERDVPPGDYVIVTVSDTGGGIPAQVLPKVFDPFFTTKPVGQGTGLGLSQVYGFARQSAGGATIRSDEGRGTTVEMLFPQVDGEPETALTTLQAPAVPTRARDCHILVVEDDPEVRRVIVECLSIIGYKVTEAANGTEGLAALQAKKPDLMVVDYAMPDMTGAEVISQARVLVGNLPVILATGYADMAAVERLAGKPTILRKPFDIAALGDAVSAALESEREKATL